MKFHSFNRFITIQFPTSDSRHFSLPHPQHIATEQIQLITLKEIHIHLIVLSSHSKFIMKYSIALIAAAFGLVSAKPSRLDTRSSPQGFDVSAWQGNVDWAKAKADGASFAIVKVITSSLSHVLSLTVITGYGKHRLRKPILCPAVWWFLQWGTHQRRIPLCPPRRELRNCPSWVFRCSRWRMVQRREDSSRNDWSRSQWKWRMLGHFHQRDGYFHPWFRRHLSLQDFEIPNDLLYCILVGYVYWKQQRFWIDLPIGPRPMERQGYNDACWMVIPIILAICGQWEVSGRSGCF